MISRLNITGYINDQTPLCVLLEMADAHGIQYNQDDINHPNFIPYIIDDIKTSTVDTTNLSQLARFINHNVSWNNESLYTAYNFMIHTTTIADNFIHGLQTPACPKTYNACLLYKICQINGIFVNQKSTIDDLAYYVKLLQVGTTTLLNQVSQLLTNPSSIHLINFLILSGSRIEILDEQSVNDKLYTIPTSLSNYEFLNSISINNIDYLRKLIQPTNAHGAIALAAINFNLDISRSTCPIREYQSIGVTVQDDHLINRVSFFDPWLNYWYKRHPDLFNLNTTFNPIFPESFYTKQQLINLALQAGYTQAEINVSSPYELLQMEYITDTFYLGPRYDIISQTTSIMMDEVGDEYLSYGTVDTSMHALTLVELYEMLKSNENFTNPFKSDAVFSSLNINKLKLLLKKCKSDLVTDLLSEIQKIEKLSVYRDSSTNKLITFFKNGSTETKDQINQLLGALLAISMTLRGWLGTGSYPIEKSVVVDADEIKISVAVTTSMINFEKMCNLYGEIGSLILELPLTFYKGGCYLPSRDIKDGITINDRLKIIKEGNTTSNMASCIRLSSNWIAASAHKYICAIGGAPPFDIAKLRYIS